MSNNLPALAPKQISIVGFTTAVLGVLVVLLKRRIR